MRLSFTEALQQNWYIVVTQSYWILQNIKLLILSQRQMYRAQYNYKKVSGKTISVGLELIQDFRIYPILMFVFVRTFRFCEVGEEHEDPG